MMKKLATFDAHNMRNELYKSSYRLSDVKNRIEKVAGAFNMVKFKDDDDAAHLWEVQSSDEGDYIVALYDTSAPSKKVASSPWQVKIEDSKISIFNNGRFITRISAKEFGIPENELHMVPKYLPQKLASDNAFANSLLKLAGAKTKANNY